MLVDIASKLGRHERRSMYRRRTTFFVMAVTLAVLTTGCSFGPTTVEEFETDAVAEARSEALDRIANIPVTALEGSVVVVDEIADECQLALSNQSGFDGTYEQYRCVVTRQVTFGSEHDGWRAGQGMTETAEELLRINDLSSHDPNPTHSPEVGLVYADVSGVAPQEPSFLAPLETPFHGEEGSEVRSRERRIVNSELMESLRNGSTPVVTLTV